MIITVLSILTLALACGTAATPATESTAEPAATTAAPTADSTTTPTAMPQATSAPGDVMTVDAEFAPSFAEYWQPPVDFYGQPVMGGTLRMIYEDPLEHGNTWGAYTGAASRLRAPTYSKIVDENPYNAGEIVPDLAQGWTNHEDGKGITLFFHEGIQWHNGEPFTCADALFSIQTMATGEGITVSDMAGKLSFLEVGQAKCTDDLTLDLRFKAPNATSLVAFTDRAAWIFNKAWFEAGGEQAMFTDLSVGTGPFVWAEGQEVGVDEQRFEKNPNYFKGDGALPYLDEVVIFGIVDESAQQAAMLAHQGNWHWVRNFGQYNAYVNHDQIMTVIGSTRGHHTVWLNNRKPPFNNVRVRQAIYMSIDREAAIQVLLQGHGSLGFMMRPGDPWALDESVGCAIPAWCPPANGDMEAQRAEARKILEEEGFPFDKTFVMTVESDEQVQARATFIQEQLRLIGVKTDFDLVETVAWREKAAQGTWGDILPRNDTMPSADPALGMGFYFRCNSANNHWGPGTECDPKSEGLLDQLAASTDQAERKALSDELQVYTMEQYWRYPIYWEQEAVAFWPEVRGYVHHPAPNSSFIKWEHVWIDPSHEDDAGFKGQTTGVPGGI